MSNDKHFAKHYILVNKTRFSRHPQYTGDINTELVTTVVAESTVETHGGTFWPKWLG